MSTNPHNDDKRLLELLERWQSGDFSRAHEQELQALTDSDEFRRETVEGFWSLPETDHAAHLASLRARLRKRTGGGRIVAFPQILAAVAAISVLVLAVIWLIPSSEKSATMSPEAAQEPLENQPIASNLPEGKSADEEMNPSSVPKLDRLDKSVQSSPPSSIMDASPVASGAASEVANATPPELSAEEAADKKPEKIVAAKPSASEDEYAKAKVAQDDDSFAPGNAASRSEAKKEEAAPSKAKDAMKKRPSAEASPSQPTGGWDKFQDYLRRNARLPEAARQNNVSGSVQLKFRLDTNNQAIDFQILKSLGYGCDEEAIRLVKAYSWQRGSDPELTLDIPFVR
ncbi:MAG: energy transducer TonB [Phycisphaerae bacterium]|nr:energy transducer TonB [Saprospiraceae bacterium]